MFYLFFNIQWFTSFEDVLTFIGVFAKFKGVFLGVKRVVPFFQVGRGNFLQIGLGCSSSL